MGVNKKQTVLTLSYLASLKEALEAGGVGHWLWTGTTRRFAPLQSLSPKMYIRVTQVKVSLLSQFYSEKNRSLKGMSHVAMPEKPEESELNCQEKVRDKAGPSRL